MSIIDISNETAAARVNFVLGMLSIPGEAFVLVVEPVLRGLERELENFPLAEQSVILEMINSARAYLLEPPMPPPAALAAARADAAAHAFAAPVLPNSETESAAWCARCGRHFLDAVHNVTPAPAESGL